ncbi:site-2 protease family protein [Aquibacillus sp. 3ASR75-54]|uniref:Site-2 protease family protein n=1 Tax=Aquibacillus salsiterrae TaxID=2950439 RepID=A0A9X3WCV2_9BACI|nr:site-2 protease family protein [Aquibacillus salsiterrae]
MGHYVAARSYQWRIRRVSLWVFGGVMETDEHGSRPIKQELIVTLAGPLQHIWIFFLLQLCSAYSLLPSSLLTVATQYNATIFLFNLLPIWPLDGGKLLMLFYASFLPFRRAHAATVLTSTCLLVISVAAMFLYYPFTLSTLLLVSFILWENRLEWKRRYYIFMRFLLKRHVLDNHAKKVRPIVVRPDHSLMYVFGRFRRNCYHQILIKDEGSPSGMPIGEKECLHTYFRLKQSQMTVGELTAFRH